MGVGGDGATEALEDAAAEENETLTEAEGISPGPVPEEGTGHGFSPIVPPVDSGAKHCPSVGFLNGIPATSVSVTISLSPGKGYDNAVPSVLAHCPRLMCPGIAISPTYISG
jgi:hypothetical protein